jgi:hypothetical protein
MTLCGCGLEKRDTALCNGAIWPGGGVMKKERSEKLMELRQTIKESVRHRKLKDLQKLIQRYFSIIRPLAIEDKNNLDYRFYKQKMG